MRVVSDPKLAPVKVVAVGMERIQCLGQAIRIGPIMIEHRLRLRPEIQFCIQERNRLSREAMLIMATTEISYLLFLQRVGHLRPRADI